MAAREIRAGRAFVELTLRDKIEQGLRRAQKRLQTFGASLRAVGTQLAAVGTAGLVGFAGMVAIFAKTADSLDKMSKRTGVSVEALSELGFAAEQSGSNLADVEQVVKRMQRSLVDAEDGGNEAADAIKAMGLSAKDLLKLNPEDQLAAFADALAGIEDPTRRSALAQIALGKSATKLLPLLSGGAAGMNELRQQARDLGLTVTTADASLGAKLTDTMNELRKSAKAVAFVIGASLAPLVNGLAKRIIPIVAATRRWIDINREVIKAIFKVTAIVTAAGAALITLGVLFASAGAIVGGLSSLLGLAAAAFVALKGAVLLLISPIGIVVAAIVAIGASLIYIVGVGDKAIGFLVQQFRSLRDEVAESFRGIADAIASGDLALAAKIAWLTLKLAIERGMGAIYTLYANFKSRLAKIGVEIFYGGAQIAADAYASLSRVVANAFAKIRGLHVSLGAFMGKWWAKRTDEAITAQADQMKAMGRAAAERVAAAKREEAIARGAKEGSQELFDIEADKEQAIARSQSGAEEFRLRESGINASGSDADGQVKTDLAQIEAERKASLAGIDADLAERSRYLEDSLSLALQNIAGDLEDQAGATAAAIAKAREEWEAAIEQARQQRATRDAEIASRPPFEFPDFGEANQRADSTRGAFDSAAALLLGSGSSVDERIARATEKANGQLGSANQLLRDIQRQQGNGIAFA